MDKVVIFGGSFDPPGKHHELIAVELAKHFSKVIVLPCGPHRMDKHTVNDTPLVHRAVMCDLAFSKIHKVEVDLSDLEQERFTPNHMFEDKFGHLGEIWMAVGTDLIAGGAKGKSKIHAWQKGSAVWKNCRFAVIKRAGFEFDPKDLPPQHIMFEVKHSGSSTQIRESYREHHPNTDSVGPGVAQYIQNYGMYLSAAPKSTADFVLQEPRLLLIHDKANKAAVRMYKKLKNLKDNRKPNAIMVIGGDGMMLEAIRQHWRMRLPFIGLNAGHRGFLLSQVEENRLNNIFLSPLKLHNLPLLYVETDGMDGQTRQSMAFNDAWVERASGQTAWVQVAVDGQVKLSRLHCDVALVSTAAGSTSYAKSMGVAPIQIDSQNLILTASSVSEPADWKQANLRLENSVTLTALDPQKRPIRGMTDSINQGRVKEMRIRISRVANAQLGFLYGYNPGDKLLAMQFPQR